MSNLHESRMQVQMIIAHPDASNKVLQFKKRKFLVSLLKQLFKKSASTTNLVQQQKINKRVIHQVVMVVHQPRYSLFTLFDEVLLLGLGGQTVYLGASEGALPYFRNLGFKMPEHEIFGGMEVPQEVGVSVRCKECVFCQLKLEKYVFVTCWEK